MARIHILDKKHLTLFLGEALFLIPLFSLFLFPVFEQYWYTLIFLTISETVLVISVALSIAFDKFFIPLHAAKIIPFSFVFFGCPVLIVIGGINKIMGLPLPYTTIISLVFFLFCFWFFFRENLTDFNRNKLNRLKNIDFENGLIDTFGNFIMNNNIMDNQYRRSKLIDPVKALILILVPLGGGGASLLVRKMEYSSQLLIVTIAMYCLVILFLPIISREYFKLFMIAKLQIIHKKWFRISDPSILTPQESAQSQNQ
jgi:hypothetical protein